MKKPCLVVEKVLASGFGVGFFPWGSGTMGALLALGIWMFLSLYLGNAELLLATLLLSFVGTGVGTWAANRLQPYWGNDPNCIVIDEMVGMWIALMGVPMGEADLYINRYYILAAFLLFRLFDIFKPLGIRALDRRVGGFWVMADDILAGVYSLIIIFACRLLFFCH